MQSFLARSLSVLMFFAVAWSGACPESQAEPSQIQDGKPVSDNNLELKVEDLSPVLNPEQFTGMGMASMAYSAAKGRPHLCIKLFCYCSCDFTDGHKSLLDCFRDTHGVDCPMCQEEVLLATKMSRNDEPLANIQKAIDEAYSSKYHFKEESPALKHYKSIRKWNPSESGSNAGAGKADGGSCCGQK